jgi:hypothetical protein
MTKISSQITTASRRHFALGEIVVTRGLAQTIEAFDCRRALQRHAVGDWGDCCMEDQNLNDDALDNSDRLLSVYHDRQGTKFWIITEADRSVTTILLPDEY